MLVNAHIQCDKNTTVYRFTIRAQSTGKQLSSFSDTTDVSCRYARYEFVDVNFDGFYDIQIAEDLALKGYIVYSFALYDPKTEAFKHSEEFSELCCGLEFDNKSKIIIRQGAEQTGRGWEYWQYKYKILQNRPVAFELVGSTEWTERDTVYIRTLVSKLIPR